MSYPAQLLYRSSIYSLLIRNWGVLPRRVLSATSQSLPQMGRTSSTTHLWLFRVSAASNYFYRKIGVCRWVGGELGRLGKLGRLGMLRNLTAFQRRASLSLYSLISLNSFSPHPNAPKPSKHKKKCSTWNTSL